LARITEKDQQINKINFELSENERKQNVGTNKSKLSSGVENDIWEINSKINSLTNDI